MVVALVQVVQTARTTTQVVDGFAVLYSKRKQPSHHSGTATHPCHEARVC